MTHTNQLTPSDKVSLKTDADNHIQRIKSALQATVDKYKKRIQEMRDTIPQFREIDIKALDPDNEELAKLIAGINTYEQDVEELTTIQSSPYFVKIDLVWTETGKSDTIFISKYSAKDQNIFSWVSPISTLRFADIGKASFAKPDGMTRHAEVSVKDTFIITNAEIVFMTHQAVDTPRQVVFQKHIAARREFLLPEIVAELDKLQDQIIRSDPHGSFLISGPAGSGKTTLALHRIAYLVLTPEFKEFFQPNNIIVFVADESATRYFGGLLPELGINGVQITTFIDWATLIANSRYKASRVPNRFRPVNMQAILEYIGENNPLPEVHPRLVLDMYRQVKQAAIAKLDVKEGYQKVVYPALSALYYATLNNYDSRLVGGFRRYLKFQFDNRYLDEVDLTILLMSLEYPIKPFAHVVVDEVQNWFPQQLNVIKSFANRIYESVTFIGDIRQKTKVFTINSWDEIGENWAEHPEQKVELLKVYRNTKQILQYLQNLGYDVEVPDNAREGTEVIEGTIASKLEARQIEVKNLIADIIAKSGNVQIGIMAKYQTSLNGLEYLGHGSEHIHVRTIEEAQGLEFHTTVVLDAQDLNSTEETYLTSLGQESAIEHTKQDKHLFYVAATRAKEQLYIMRS